MIAARFDIACDESVESALAFAFLVARSDLSAVSMLLDLQALSKQLCSADPVEVEILCSFLLIETAVQ